MLNIKGVEKPALWKIQHSPCGYILQYVSYLNNDLYKIDEPGYTQLLK